MDGMNIKKQDVWKALGGAAIVTLLLFLCGLAAAAPARAGGSDSPAPYTVNEQGITLPQGQIFQAHGHVNIKTDQGPKNIHFDPNNNQPGGVWIGKSSIPWSAFGLTGDFCVSWVQMAQYNEHFGEGGQSPVCVLVDTGETVTRDWWLPNDGTPDNVTWPQPVYTNQTCGWVQRDTYKYGTAQQRAIVDALDDDGVLTNAAEDAPVYISHTWVQIGGCPQPTPTPTPTQPGEEPSPTTPANPTPTPTQPSTEPTPTPEPPVTEPALPPSSASPQPTLDEPSDEPLKPSVVSTQGPVQDVTRTELARTGTSPLPWALGALALIGGGAWMKWRSKNA